MAKAGIEAATAETDPRRCAGKRERWPDLRRTRAGSTPAGRNGAGMNRLVAVFAPFEF